MINDLIALVVVPQHHEPLAKLLFRRAYSPDQLFSGQRAVERRQRILDRRAGRNHVVLARSGPIVWRNRRIEIPRLLLEFRVA